MQYDVATPAAYMEALEPDWRRDCIVRIRTLIQAHLPELVEGIQYKMLSYADDRGVIFHLNAQKHYVSLYVGDANKIDPEGQLLAGLDVGKGCVRIKKTSTVPDDTIAQLLKQTVQLWRQGLDLGC